MSDTPMTKQILLTRLSPAYWRVTFNHPPLNIFGPDAIPQLNDIITALETDEHVKVVVFDSAIQGFFLTHYDETRGYDRSTTRADRAAASA
jgi:enoyl-CoA hydratase/carnithine racemase